MTRTPPSPSSSLTSQTLGELFAHLIGPGPGGFILLDQNYTVQWANSASASPFERNEIATGIKITDQIPNELSSEIQHTIECVKHSGNSISLDFKSNADRYYNLRVNPIDDDNFKGFSLDISEITHSIEFNKLMQAVLNTSVSGVMILEELRDKQGNTLDLQWTMVNFAEGNLFDYRQEQLLGKYLLQEMPWMKKDQLYDRLVEVASGKEPSWSDEVQYLSKTGKNLWFTVSALHVSNGVAVTFTDITEKKAFEAKLAKTFTALTQSQQELNRLNDHLEELVIERTQKLQSTEELMLTLSSVTNDALWDWNCSQNLLWFNEAFYKTFKYKPEYFSDGIRKLFEAVHPEDRNRLRQGLEQSVNDGLKEWACEFRLLESESKSFHYVMGRCYLLRNQGGRVYRIIGCMVDITQHQQYEEALEGSLVRIKKMNAETKAFSEKLSNELKAPLRAISSLANWLLDEEEGLSDEGRLQLELLLQNSENAASFLRKVHDRQTETDSYTNGTDLRSLLQTIQKQYRNVSVNTKLDRPVRLVGDPSMMEKLFYDLLDGINESDHPDVSIKITAGKANCTFSLLDNSPGSRGRLISRADNSHQGREICSFTLPVIRKDQRWDIQ